MTTTDAMLATCRRTLGTHEQPAGSNRTPFAACAGHADGLAWCATWLVCMAKRAGLKLPAGASGAYTPTMAQAYRDAGRWSEQPHVGAFVFFAWPGMGRIAHVGIVEAIRPDGRLVTLEGNTNQAGSREGDGVYRKVRSMKYVAGFGLPAYSKPVKAPTGSVKRTTPTIALGSRRNAVGEVQDRLGLKRDNVFGRLTDRAVRDFQAAHRLTVDGVVGPKTWAALRRAR